MARRPGGVLNSWFAAEAEVSHTGRITPMIQSIPETVCDTTAAAGYQVNRTFW